MAIIQFGPPLSLYSVDIGVAVIFLVGPLNIVWWMWEGIWVEGGFKLHAQLHIIISKISASSE